MAPPRFGRYCLPSILCISVLFIAACGGGSMQTTTTTSGTPAEWVWMSGSNTVEASGVYGTLGVAAAGNVPGARYFSVSWTDRSGNFWLFGGATGILTVSVWNDLWEYNPTTNEWTWMGGSTTANASGSYGTLGVPSASNFPGGRLDAVSWTDSSGNFWLFGGDGIDSNGNFDSLNDLWEFDPTTKQWTWMSGSDTANATAVYGTIGVAAAGNVPGPRIQAVSWTDASGNLWLFGGCEELYGPNDYNYLNDLWEFNPTTKEWTWVGGSDTPNASGSYGTLGVAAAGNVPGARTSAVSWTDGSGNFSLFGGVLLTPSSASEWNDLWEFNPATKEWTWMSGSNTANATAAYGMLGVAATGNVPGARCSPTSWIDSSGNLWLFGGFGYDSTEPTNLNDLWEFNPTTKEWVWMSGSNMGTAVGNYGMMGVPSASNFPGSRGDAVGWIDSSNNLWLFGGFGFDTNGEGAELNDLWRWQPAQP